jgi:hypothetical protein
VEKIKKILRLKRQPLDCIVKRLVRLQKFNIK